MDMLRVPGQSSSNSDDEYHDCTPAPDSSRHTSHTGHQGGLSGLSYGFMVGWHHLRPFIPFFLISFMVVALVYLMQAIVYGGPFKDPLFFVKFNERWPRPAPLSPTPTKALVGVSSSSSVEQLLVELHRDNETMWTVLQKVEELFFKDCPAIVSGLLKDTDYFDFTYGWFITCMFVPHLPFFI